MMKPLEQMLSPMIKNRVVNQPLNQNDIILMEKIRQQKVDLIEQRLTPSQIELVRPEVVDSWLRSYNYGLDLFDYNYGPILDRLAFQERVREKELLLKAADPYICQLEAMLADAQCIILLSDEEGAMLRIIEGNQLLEQQNKRFNLVPGSIWNEETVGTCAHGISLIQGTPMQICGPEHYCEQYDQISCSSAPIFDVNYNLAGSLCIVTPSFSHQSSQSLGLVVSMAWAVQNQFHLALHNELLNVTLEASEEALLTINKSGVITKANVVARRMFNYLEQDIAGIPIEMLLGKQPLISSVLNSGQSVYDAEIEIEHLSQRLAIRSAQPLKDHLGQNFGCIISLRKLNRAKTAGDRKGGLEAGFTFNHIVGKSPQLLRSTEIARKFANLDANLLIQGESGTGKEMYAQAIHNASRPGGPFVAVNCAAIPRTLIESELFGYEGGAFTGAERQGRPGKLELANGGTLFLDEIGDMPLELQPVLLRVLEEKKVMRVGGSRYVQVDFRLITATNKDLLAQVECGQFRQDLYYRLKVLKIDIPPLRERGADIMQLAQHFIISIAERQQVPAPDLSDLAALQLLNYSWPGNVRQLENCMLYAVNVCQDKIIKPQDLPEEIAADFIISPQVEGSVPRGLNSLEANLSMKEIERIMIAQTLLQVENNISEAAILLGMSRSTLYRKIKEYQL